VWLKCYMIVYHLIFFQIFESLKYIPKYALRLLLPSKTLHSKVLQNPPSEHTLKWGSITMTKCMCITNLLRQSMTSKLHSWSLYVNEWQIGLNVCKDLIEEHFLIHLFLYYRSADFPEHNKLDWRGANRKRQRCHYCSCWEQNWSRWEEVTCNEWK
jgi:hypothetical protein